MRNILAITTKELKTFFASPMAYVIAATFLMINGFFFAQDLLVVQLAPYGRLLWSGELPGSS